MCLWFMGSSVTNDNFVFRRRSLLLHNPVGFCSIASHLEIDEAETRCFFIDLFEFVCFYIRCVHYSSHLPSSIQIFWEEKKNDSELFFLFRSKRMDDDDWRILAKRVHKLKENDSFQKRTNWIENEQSTRGLVERPYTNVYIYNSCNCEFNENFLFHSHVCDRLKLNNKKNIN